MTKSGQILCKSCGICCDGTLFSAVPLDKNEDKKKYLLLTIIKNEIQLPCAKFSHLKGCEIYVFRPNLCRKFRCRLLKQLETRKITMEQALTRVQITKDEINKIKLSVEERFSFFEERPLMSKFNLLFQNNTLEVMEADNRKEYATAYLAQVSLSWLLDRHFRGNKREPGKDHDK